MGRLHSEGQVVLVRRHQSAENDTYKEADPIYANHALGVIDRKITTYDYTGKIDYNLGTKHQFEGSVFGDPASTPITFNKPLSTVPAPGPIDTALKAS